MFLWSYVLHRPNSKFRAAKKRHIEDHREPRAVAEGSLDDEGGDEEQAVVISTEDAAGRLTEEDAGALRDSLHHAHQISGHSRRNLALIASRPPGRRKLQPL